MFSEGATKIQSLLAVEAHEVMRMEFLGSFGVWRQCCQDSSIDLFVAISTNQSRSGWRRSLSTHLNRWYLFKSTSMLITRRGVVERALRLRLLDCDSVNSTPMSFFTWSTVRFSSVSSGGKSSWWYRVSSSGAGVSLNRYSTS